MIDLIFNIPLDEFPGQSLILVVDSLQFEFFLVLVQAAVLFVVEF